MIFFSTNTATLSGFSFYFFWFLIYHYKHHQQQSSVLTVEATLNLGLLFISMENLKSAAGYWWVFELLSSLYTSKHCKGWIAFLSNFSLYLGIGFSFQTVDCRCWLQSIKFRFLSAQFYIHLGIYVIITVSDDLAITSESSLESNPIHWKIDSYFCLSVVF